VAEVPVGVLLSVLSVLVEVLFSFVVVSEVSLVAFVEISVDAYLSKEIDIDS
jgi:hypothetical protein